MMINREVLLAILLLIGSSCTSVREPNERLVRTSGSYESDLRGLKQYIGQSPVDVVVAGYTPEMTTDIPMEFSDDSLEITIKQAVIVKMDPVATYLRPKGAPAKTYTIVPTDNVVRISADGFLPPVDSGRSALWLIPIVTGAFALYVSIRLFAVGNLFGKDNFDGCVMIPLAILAAVICIGSAIVILVTKSPEAYETLRGGSKVWTFQ